jgi:hypothetical protein
MFDAVVRARREDDQVGFLPIMTVSSASRASRDVRTVASFDNRFEALAN